MREHAVIGENCILSKDVYIDTGVNIGNSCKIQNSVSVYSGVTLENNVFIGPNACFTNDLTPRAFNNDWHTVKTQICEGASIGANATIICGNKIGKFAMIGAGTVVTKDIPEYALAVETQQELLVMLIKMVIGFHLKKLTNKMTFNFNSNIKI